MPGSSVEGLQPESRPDYGLMARWRRGDVRPRRQSHRSCPRCSCHLAACSCWESETPCSTPCRPRRSCAGAAAGLSAIAPPLRCTHATQGCGNAEPCSWSCHAPCQAVDSFAAQTATQTPSLAQYERSRGAPVLDDTNEKVTQHDVQQRAHPLVRTLPAQQQRLQHAVLAARNCVRSAVTAPRGVHCHGHRRKGHLQ